MQIVRRFLPQRERPTYFFWSPSGVASNQYMTQQSTAVGSSSAAHSLAAVSAALGADAMRWPTNRLKLLAAALDPDEDGKIDSEDLSSLASVLSIDRTCSRAPQPPAAPPPPPPSAPPQTMALSSHVTDRVEGPAFVRGFAPVSKKATESHYYFRPMENATPAADEDPRVFELCAERCLRMPDCWFLSISHKYRDCSIHTGMFKFTSQSV